MAPNTQRFPGNTEPTMAPNMANITMRPSHDAAGLGVGFSIAWSSLMRLLAEIGPLGF